MNTIAVIADDLTGAADTGIQFARSGLRANVLLTPRPAAGPQAAVTVGVTDSRQDSPEVARSKVTAWARFLAAGLPQPGLLYKKVDSTLRGNPAAELDACLDAFPGHLAIFAPAFPATGRTTVGGIHLLYGRPLEESEMAADPTTPIHDSRILNVLASQTRRRIGHLPLAAVSAGGPVLLDSLRRLVADGAAIIASDAACDEDLARLVAAVRSLAAPVIWTGSAGLAQQLLEPGPAAAPEAGAPFAAPLLVVAGSLSPTLRRQVERFCAETGAACTAADAALLTNPAGDATAELARVAAATVDALRAGRSAVVTTTVSPTRPADPVAVGRIISDQLGLIARQVLEQGVARGMVMSGGDTALGVCRKVDATGMRLVDELRPGITLGRLLDGRFAGLPVVTKAGSFGGEDALCQISRIAAGSLIS